MYKHPIRGRANIFLQASLQIPEINTGLVGHLQPNSSELLQADITTNGTQDALPQKRTYTHIRGPFRNFDDYLKPTHLVDINQWANTGAFSVVFKKQSCCI